MSRRISSPRLFGRDHELTVLTAAFEDARDGRGRLVVVEGDAGMGKTRLVDHFVTKVDAAVLAGGGIPLAGDAPYAPMIEVFRTLGRLLPERADVLLPQVAQADPLGVTRLLSATADAVRALAEVGPVVLVVEDLHWTDAATRDLLTFLARTIRLERVLLLASVRAEELTAGEPLATYVAELLRLAHAERLTLPPLSSVDVAAQAFAITGARPAAESLARLIGRAAGNPLFTEELLAAGPEAGKVPVTIRDVLLARLDRLPPAGRRVLRAAATLGRTMPPDLLAIVAAGPAVTDTDTGLTALVRRGFLVPIPDGYAFRHPMIQETVYADTPGPLRRDLHARAAAALAASPPGDAIVDRAGHAAQLAYHWREAGRDGPALAAAVRAGQLAMAAYAPAEALAHYRDALARWILVPEAPAVAGVDAITLREQAAEAASAAGDSTFARDLGAQVVASIDPVREPVRAALRLERLGRLSWLDGDATAAWAAYEQALRLIPSAPSVARTRVLAGTAQSLMLQNRFLASAGFARQAIDTARAADARAELAHAQNTLGTGLAMIGHHDQGQELMREAAAGAAAVGDETEVARCFVNRTEAYVHALAGADAIRIGEEGAEYAIRVGLGRVHAGPILGSLLDGLYLCGRWAELDTRFIAAMDSGLSPWCTVPILVPHCRINILRGRLTEAATDLAAIEAVPGAADDTQYGPLLTALRARLAAARGDFDAARAAIDAAGAAIGENLFGLLDIVAVGVQLEADAFDAHRRAGRRVDAGAATARATSLRAAASTAVDRVVAAGGRFAASFACLDAVAAAHQARIADRGDPDVWAGVATNPLADPYTVATARYHQAAALFARRRRHDATTALTEASELADRLGAAPLADHATTLARRAGVKPAEEPPATVADPLGLTRREREVIALLDAGLSNARIAQALYISEKTASVHVSNILRKLGVTSRLQAANAARSLDPS